MKQQLDVLQKVKSILKLKSYHAYIVPKNGEFTSSYISKDKDRLYKLTNFTGSNGLAIVFSERKPIFMTDNRYKLQSQLEVDKEIYEILDPEKSEELTQILIKNLPQNSTVVLDGSLFSTQLCQKLQSTLKPKQINLFVNLEQSLFDQSLDSQESKSASTKEVKIFSLQDQTYSFDQKVEQVLNHSKMQNMDAIFVSSIEEVNWLLNLRALGIHEYEPLLNGVLLLLKDGNEKFLFVDSQTMQALKKEQQILSSLKGVTVKDIQQFRDTIKECKVKEKTIGIDLQSCTQNYYQILSESFKELRQFEISPLSDLRVVKSQSEIKGFQEALKLESAALITLYAKLQNITSSKRQLYEHEVPEILDNYRSMIAGNQFYRQNSFPMILGSGPNGAIIHYRAEAGSSKLVEQHVPMLCDTGAQYLSGTTDTTRTLLFNKQKMPDSHYQHLSEMYTRVLMGNLDLQETKFPKDKTYGAQLDAIARRHLWEVKKDFKHGIGHGVSHCGPVHEYPHYAYNKQPKGAIHLQAGMVITNEPGYYEEGNFGIRIENMLMVKDADKEYLQFKSLTLVPYCRLLINQKLLSFQHMKTLNDYYERIDSEVTQVLNDRLDNQSKFMALDYLRNEIKKIKL